MVPPTPSATIERRRISLRCPSVKKFFDDGRSVRPANRRGVGYRCCFGIEQSIFAAAHTPSIQLLSVATPARCGPHLAINPNQRTGRLESVLGPDSNRGGSADDQPLH